MNDTEEYEPIRHVWSVDVEKLENGRDCFMIIKTEFEHVGDGRYIRSKAPVVSACFVEHLTGEKIIEMAQKCIDFKHEE